ncbi:MAG: hypothetical protein ACR2GS_09760, partial [Thermomicrobiales bacterium]
MAIDTPLPQRQLSVPHPGLWQRTIATLRISIVLLAALVIGGSATMLGILIIDPNGSEEFT